MRKVTLSMKAQEKCNTIKRLAEGHITKSCAAVKIGCTTRHVNRLLSAIAQKANKPSSMGIPDANLLMLFLTSKSRRSSLYTAINTGMPISPIAANSSRKKMTSPSLLSASAASSLRNSSSLQEPSGVPKSS